MKIDIDLNDVQTMLMELAKRHGLSEEGVHEEWSLSYRKALQIKFEDRLNLLLESMQLYKEALKNGDEITAKCAVIDAEVKAGLIRDDFGALSDDLRRAIRLNTTLIPDGFKIPEDYDYSRR